jgi:thiol:disulfide interchange protein DsbA
MRSLRFAFVAVLMVTNIAFASSTDPKTVSTTLSAPQPVQATGKKVEVIEFFAYHCPACNSIEPTSKSVGQEVG